MMRLWHYALLPVLPNKMVVAEWRECLSIKRQWEKGTLKHRLVSYVMDYDKAYFCKYLDLVKNELKKRNIKFQKKYYDEIYVFCNGNITAYNNYPEHNDRYLRQNLYNLEEKAIRGIISKEEWKVIYNKFRDFTDLWEGD